jgi:AcrR family transcriptional regulator
MEKTQQIGNRRGQRSRQEILEAASRVMSSYGYAGTSMSALVEATGIPKSAIYHHFGSKAGLLAEVMAQGAHGFFMAMREAHRNPPQSMSPRDRLGWYLQKSGEVFVHREEFLRLLLVIVMGDQVVEAPQALQTVVKVRDEGREYMREMIRSSFAAEGEAIANAIADELAHFGMLGFDGAFVSLQSGDQRPMSGYMAQLTDAMVALGEACAAKHRAGAGDAAHAGAAKDGRRKRRTSTALS